MKIKNFQDAKNLRFLSMKKILFAGMILLVLIGLVACAPSAEEKETVKITSGEEKPATTTTKPTTETKPSKPAEPYCGDGKCDSDEDCAGCAKDCGECGISLFSGECERKGIYHTVNLQLKNPNANQLNIEAYPRGTFTDVGVFYGDTRELIIEGRSLKAYTWSFNIGENKIADEAKMVMMGANNKIITNEITIECVED